MIFEFTQLLILIVSIKPDRMMLQKKTKAITTGLLNFFLLLRHRFPGKKKFLLLFLIIAGIIVSFGFFYSSSFFKGKSDYTFSAPDKLFKLPHVLDEISGITAIDNDEIACVQDEIGSIFIYDIALEHLVKEYKNSLVGDFEGIAFVNNTMFVLRSDGVLVEYSDYKSVYAYTKEYYLNLPSANNEGLCYDKKNNCLLIAAKSKADDDSEKKNIRLIYSFNLQTKQVAPDPMVKLHIKRIESKAIELNIIDSKPAKHKDDSFNFRPSEIAVHPINNCIYVLSSKDKMLLILNQKGKIEDLIALDPAYFTQAEGMTFLSNGDMLISNEAQKGKATLLLFKYRK